MTLSGPATTPEQMLELICRQLRRVPDDRGDVEKDIHLTDKELIITYRFASYAAAPYKGELTTDDLFLPKAGLLQIINEALEKGSGEAMLEGREHYRLEFIKDYDDLEVKEKYEKKVEVKVFLRINEGKPSFDYEVKRGEG